MKPTGERQVGRTLAEIKPDHVARYRWALRQLPLKGLVVDAACGIGYGSKMMHEPDGLQVLGLDRCKEAIAEAREWYPGPDYEVVDLDRWQPDPETINAVVSFETIEHLSDPAPFLAAVHRCLVPNGMFLFSTPNQSVMPFGPTVSRFHFRHYTVGEARQLMRKSGFNVEHVWHQSHTGVISFTGPGKFLLMECRKV